MNRRAIVTVRGKRSEWGVPTDLPPQTIADMRADGLDIIEPVNSIPLWAAASGLTAPWFFAQDVFQFRNPFRSKKSEK